MTLFFERGVDPDTGNENGWGSPLYRSIKEGLTDKAEVLLKAGVSPRKACASRGRTDLARYRNEPGGEVIPINMAAYLGRTDIVKLLLRHGAKINDANFRGETVLHAAVLGYNPKSSEPSRSTKSSISSVIRLGADRKLRTKAGETAYDIAKRKGYTELLSTLQSR